MSHMRSAPSEGSFVWEPEPGASAPTTSARFPWENWFLVLLSVAALGWWGTRALKDTSESIVRIRNHPARFDGKSIVLKGQVGDVFDMSGSYAYYLHQGADAIVVFTRGTPPTPHTTVTVHGSISMGYLDGAPHPALFERSGKR